MLNSGPGMLSRGPGLLSRARQSSTYSRFRPVGRIAIVRGFLRVMPGGRFDDHRPVYLPHFLRSSAWSRMARAKPLGGAALRCDGALTAGRPCCGGR